MASVPDTLFLREQYTWNASPSHSRRFASRSSGLNAWSLPPITSKHAQNLWLRQGSYPRFRLSSITISRSLYISLLWTVHLGGGNRAWASQLLQPLHTHTYCKSTRNKWLAIGKRSSLLHNTPVPRASSTFVTPSFSHATSSAQVSITSNQHQNLSSIMIVKSETEYVH